MVTFDRYVRLSAFVLILGGTFTIGSSFLAQTDNQNKRGFEFIPHTITFDQIPLHETGTRFPIIRIERIGLTAGEASGFNLDIAHYRGQLGQPHSAIIYLNHNSTTPKSIALPNGLNELRWNAWLDAADALRELPSESPMIMTWWDNGQRIDLLTGLRSWIKSPVAAAFTSEHQEFWKMVSGGFEKQPQRSIELADWLLTDSELAMESIKKAQPLNADNIYFLVTIDDLARLAELCALTGKPIPFETRLFEFSGDIHGLISRIKHWSQLKGNGHYLVQHLPSNSVRAWRITSTEGERTLLAGLLPFTSSLKNPNQHLKLIHRSSWSGYISIYLQKI